MNIPPDFLFYAAAASSLLLAYLGYEFGSRRGWSEGFAAGKAKGWLEGRRSEREEMSDAKAFSEMHAMLDEAKGLVSRRLMLMAVKAMGTHVVNFHVDQDGFIRAISQGVPLAPLTEAKGLPGGFSRS